LISIKQTEFVNEMRNGRNYVITTNNVFYFNLVPSPWFQDIHFKYITVL